MPCIFVEQGGGLWLEQCMPQAGGDVVEDEVWRQAAPVWSGITTSGGL